MAEESISQSTSPTGLYLYCIQAGTRGPVKIGISNNPWKRLQSIQTSIPSPLKLVAQWAGNREDEQELHLRFKKFWVRGEWFRPEPEILNYVLMAQWASEQSLPLPEIPIIYQPPRQHVPRRESPLTKKKVSGIYKKRYRGADGQLRTYRYVRVRCVGKDGRCHSKSAPFDGTRTGARQVREQLRAQLQGDRE